MVAVDAPPAIPVEWCRGEYRPQFLQASGRSLAARSQLPRALEDGCGQLAVLHSPCLACQRTGARVREAPRTGECARMRRRAQPRPTPSFYLQGALLHEQFDAVAAARPDAVCLVDDATGVSLTYREVAEAVDTLAAALAKLGVTRDIGERTDLFVCRLIAAGLRSGATVVWFAQVGEIRPAHELHTA